jgi:predicted component of type VI protein secretion system
VRPDGSKQEVRMKRARLTIGRKPESDIRIAVPSVSRDHCEIVVEDGKLKVRDLGSSNGTYVNRERVQETELGPGSMLGVGPAVFVVRIDGNPAEIDAKAALASGKAPEPVAAAAAPKARPSSPAGAKAPARPAPKKPDDSDEIDVGHLDESSVSDFDFDLLDDEDEKQPGL